MIFAPSFSTPLGTPGKGAGHRCDPFDGGGALVVDGAFHVAAESGRGGNGWDADASPPVRACHGTSPPAIVYHVNAAGSTAKKDHALEADHARCLDTTGGFASGQGGTLVADPIIYARDAASTLDAEGGHRFRSDGGSDNVVVAAQCHGGNVGPMGTLRCGNGNVTGGVPFIGGADVGVRRLTPLETERLQGFPDKWTDIEGATDAQRYRTTGNAVAVPVIYWLGRRIAAACAGRAGLVGRVADTGRAARRVLALLIARAAGPRVPQVPVEEFRVACIELGIYDPPNFAQDMKKDARLFREVRGRSGQRLGWSLTEKGRAEAGRLPPEADGAAAADDDRLVAGSSSRRDAQRRIALRLLSRPGATQVGVEELREACVRLGVYDRANFAQDMKKDGRLFAPVAGPDGRRTGWALTDEGRSAARSLEMGLSQPVGVS